MHGEAKEGNEEANVRLEYHRRYTITAAPLGANALGVVGDAAGSDGWTKVLLRLRDESCEDICKRTCVDVAAESGCSEVYGAILKAVTMAEKRPVCPQVNKHCCDVFSRNTHKYQQIISIVL